MFSWNHTAINVTLDNWRWILIRDDRDLSMHRRMFIGGAKTQNTPAAGARSNFAAVKMAKCRMGPLSVGYDEEFVNPLDDDFTCLICQVALREPVLTRCGHRFCRGCLEQCFSRWVSTQFSETTSKKLELSKLRRATVIFFFVEIVSC